MINCSAVSAMRRLSGAFVAALFVLFVCSAPSAWAQAPNFIVSSTRLMTNENGSTATFTIRLTVRPDSDVTVTYTTSRPTEGVFLVNNVRQNSASVTFSPNETFSNAWNREQTLTIVGVDDGAVDGLQNYQLNPSPAQSLDPAYNNLRPPTIFAQNADNESPGLTVTPSVIIVFEGQTVILNVTLNQQPQDFVRFTLTKGQNPAEFRLNTTELLFSPTDFNVPHAISITGLQDNIKDGDQPITLNISNAVSTDLAYNGRFGRAVLGTVLDTSQPGVNIQPTGIVTRETESNEPASTAGFTVQLNTRPQPNTSVRINIASTDPTEGTVSPTFLVFSPLDTATNAWNKPQTVRVTGVNDFERDGDVTYPVQLTIDTTATTDDDYDALGPYSVSVTNRDNEAPGVILSTNRLITSEATAQQSTSFTVRLTGPPVGNVTYPVRLGIIGRHKLSTPSQPSLADAVNLVFTPSNWFSAQTVFVTTINNRIDDGDVNYRIITGPASAPSDPGYQNKFSNSVFITVFDDDTSGFTITPTSVQLNGRLVTTEDPSDSRRRATFRISLNSQPRDNVTASLEVSNTNEAVLQTPFGPLPFQDVTFTPQNFGPQTITVVGIDDSESDGNVPY
ncbi:MAG: hypothetical protein M3347_17545, partial [Armatimonadota bacterium]|nr:hypothetical protein [Armatimonadota bacterium]